MPDETLTRRTLLTTSGAALGALALGCSESDGPLEDAGLSDTLAMDAGQPDALAPDAMDTSVPLDASGPDVLDVGDVALAIGGTAGFFGAFLDPFEDAPGPACELTCAQTLGPCYADVQLERRDVTDGRIGWPTRLAFRLLQADGCTPLEGALVEIWHTDSEGNYSAVDNPTCHPFEAEAPSETFMRGTQRSDANGRVDFDAVFPGWYPGRTPHIHVQIRIGDAEMLTTQVYFRDELAAFAYRIHDEYNHRPVQDTANAGDVVARRIRVDDFIVDDRLVEGDTGAALQCWYTFIVRSSADGPSC